MKHVASIVGLAFVVFAVGCSSNSSSPTGPGGSTNTGSKWSVQTLDSAGTVGEFSHIAVDTAGHVAVSYFKRTTGMIRCERLTGTSWTIADVGNATGPYVTTGYNSIGMTAAGNPVVLYHKADDAYYLTSYTGSAWTSPSIIGWTEAVWAFIGRNALAVDRTTGVAHAALSLYDSKNGWVQGYWHSPNASAAAMDGPAGGGTGENMGIAVDGSGNIHVAYEYTPVSHTTAMLRYAKYNGTSWSITTVDSIGDGGNFTSSLISIAVGPDGTPHIAYYTLFSGYKYAHWTGSAWDKNLIQAYGSVGWCDQSIAVDKNNVPHVALLMGSYKLLYAKRVSGAWTIETVDTKTGFSPSVGVAGDGKVYIAYYDDWTYDLKLAVRTP